MRALPFLFALLLIGCSTAPPPEAGKQASSSPEPPKITQFYASKPSISRGEKSLLCYGGENARSVALPPPEQELPPSPPRCIEVTPAATTTYRLSARNESGAETTK